MANLSVNEGILAAYPWLKEILAATGSCQTRILMVADGVIDFGHQLFGLSRLVEALKQGGRPGHEIIVSTAHRGGREGRRVAGDYQFRFEEGNFGIELYEQVWLFGYQSDVDELSEAELKVLAEFMNEGGGVFATGDHEDLGLALCGNVPRVRSMRKWRFDEDKVCGPSAPPRDEPCRHSTVHEGRDPGYQATDESDDIPQTIVPRLFLNGCEVNPHELLAFGNTPITVLPDHMHEGECVEPTEEQLEQPYKFPDGTEFAEFPLMADGETRPAPEIIALSVSAGGRLKERDDFHPPVIPRGFGAICAYDGDNVSVLEGHTVGRVVVDSSFHHFTDGNLDGAEAQLGRGFFDADGKPTKDYAVITQYFRNLAAYLNPLVFRGRCNRRLLLLLRFMYPLIEEIRPDEKLTLNNIVEVGELTRRAISSYFSPAHAVEFALTLLNSVEGFDELKISINPRLAKRSDLKDVAALVNSHTLTNALLGVALLRTAGQLPHEAGRVAEELGKIESRGLGLEAEVKDGVRQVASIWEPIIKQARAALSAFSSSPDGDEK
jgi:hypothetical protein